MLFSRNVNLEPPVPMSGWRKIAMGTWKSAGDPSVYGIIDADMGPALQYIEDLRAQTGLKITITHFIGKALAEVFSLHPDINCILRFGRLYPRKTVDIFFQVASDLDGKDLSGMTIREADRKSLASIAREMQERVNQIRKEGDPAFRKMKDMMTWMPGFLAWPLVNFSGFLMYSLNLYTKLLGVPRDPFGSAMVTSIGSLGLDMAFVPLVPYSRVPLLMAVGATQERPVVKNGSVTTAPIARLCVTFDHRLIDGVHAAHMMKTLNRILQNPSQELTR